MWKNANRVSAPVMLVVVMVFTYALNMQLPRLTNREYLEQLLAKKQITPQRSMGQNFLICEEAVTTTLEVLGEEPLLVTELGAGLGVLTGPLLAAGHTVRAIERDHKLAELLRKLLPSTLRSRLTLEATDLRAVQWTWDRPYSLVGNIPYTLSGFIIRRITQLDPAPQQVVLLVQREVGERLTAAAPKMHLSTLAIRLWGSATQLLTLPADCFFPVPKVSSQLIFLTPRRAELVSLADREETLRIAKYFFQMKRKQMQGILRSLLHVEKERAVELLTSVAIEPTWRPQNVHEDQWVRLAHQITKT